MRIPVGLRSTMQPHSKNIYSMQTKIISVYKHLEEDNKPEGLLLNLLLMEFSAIGNSTLLTCKTGSLLTASI